MLDATTSFSDFVRQRRRAADLTQEQLAEQVGYAVATLRAIEAGRRRPSREMAERLAEIFALPGEQQVEFLRLARQDALPDPAPPVAMPPAPRAAPPAPQPAALPTAPTPLIGRAAELAAIKGYLADPACRLLTLFGPGGIGKTRLALQAAHEIAREGGFPDGVAWVNLTPISTVEHAVSAIAGALGLSLQGATPSELQLQEFLRERRILLAIDNLEHLLDATPLLNRMLEAAPGLTMITTSRERLRVRNEQIFTLSGLPVPGPAAPPVESPAMLLFLDRARRVLDSFTLTADNIAAISEICALLDGLPLGIELSASWVRVLSPQEIAEEIRRGLDFLSMAGRDLPERHRSLRAVFDHSWQLLTPDERQALARLTVFRGGWTREAAAAITADLPGPPGPGPRFSILTTLAALIDKSLLRRGDSSSTARYDMHEQVRQYAAELLAADPAAQRAVRQQHSAYYLELFRQRAADAPRLGWSEVWAGLRPDMDNLRQAWEWANIQRDLPALSATAPLLAALIDAQSWLRDGIALFGRSAELLSNAAPGSDQDRLLGQMQLWLGSFLFRNGQFALARQHLRGGIARLAGDDQLFAATATLGIVGVVVALMDDYAAGRQMLERRLQLLREGLDQDLLARNLVYLAIVAWHQGDYAAARASLAEAAAIWPSRPNQRGQALTLLTLGMVELSEGKPDLAVAHWQQALQLCAGTTDTWSRGAALAHLGRAALLRGDLEEARALTQEAVDLAQDHHDRWSIGLRLGRYGQLAAFCGDASARTAVVEAARIGRESRHAPILLMAAAGLAGLLGMAGQGDLALMLLAHLDDSGADAEARALAGRLRDRLGAPYEPARLAEIAAAGRQRPLLDLLGEAEAALGGAPPP